MNPFFRQDAFAVLSPRTMNEQTRPTNVETRPRHLHRHQRVAQRGCPGFALHIAVGMLAKQNQPTRRAIKFQMPRQMPTHHRDTFVGRNLLAILTRKNPL
jgi:hypothetical protein